MSAGLQGVAEAVAAILAAPRKGRRRLVAVSGPPASGKSTLAETLAADLCEAGAKARVVPMDGFHLDNRLLEARGLLPRKGAPETFDAAGFAGMVARCGREAHVIYPVFDRARDIAIAGAGHLGPEVETVVVEGNYLMLDSGDWSALGPLWDVSIALDVPMEILRARLLDRWRAHGLSPDAALARAEGNDLPNARRVLQEARPTDYIIG